nr:hypothetical protein [Tanacetum cinerariifolium]
MVRILAGQLTTVAAMANASFFHDVLLRVWERPYLSGEFTPTQPWCVYLPNAISWLGSHTDNVNEAVAEIGQCYHIRENDMHRVSKGVPVQHKDKSIIAFLVDELIEKADGFSGVFPDKSCAALAYLPLLII